jgi:abortive infection bacteriophage resistance protein
MQYSKQATTIQEQINLLLSRGMQIPDITEAEHFLTNISYYRLAGYWWPMQSDKVHHIFKPGSRFDHVIALYNFDRELRILLFDVIERIEIGLRTRRHWRSLALPHFPNYTQTSDHPSNLRM